MQNFLDIAILSYIPSLTIEKLRSSTKIKDSEVFADC